MGQTAPSSIVEHEIPQAVLERARVSALDLEEQCKLGVTTGIVVESLPVGIGIPEGIEVHQYLFMTRVCVADRVNAVGLIKVQSGNNVTLTLLAERAFAQSLCPLPSAYVIRMLESGPVVSVISEADWKLKEEIDRMGEEQAFPGIPSIAESVIGPFEAAESYLEGMNVGITDWGWKL